jgi:hypothetical protein
MLQALMDRRARTAGELARLAKIAPSTRTCYDYLVGVLTNVWALPAQAPSP